MLEHLARRYLGSPHLHSGPRRLVSTPNLRRPLFDELSIQGQFALNISPAQKQKTNSVSLWILKFEGFNCDTAGVVSSIQTSQKRSDHIHDCELWFAGYLFCHKSTNLYDYDLIYTTDLFSSWVNFKFFFKIIYIFLNLSEPIPLSISCTNCSYSCQFHT